MAIGTFFANPKWNVAKTRTEDVMWYQYLLPAGHMPAGAQLPGARNWAEGSFLQWPCGVKSKFGNC